MEKYKEYKDSGVQWLGEIPSHWKVVRGKYLLRIQTSSSKRNNKIGLENIECFTGKYISTITSFEGDGVDFDEGDIVYGKLRPYLCKVWLAEFAGNAVGDFWVYKVSEEYDKRYAKYIMLSHSFTDVCNASTYGAKMPRVSHLFIQSLLMPVPVLVEQRSIVSYLDTKCSLLDTLLSNKEKEISLLQEMKQRVIADAVTRGVNPNVKFKATNIPWLPEIPEHWEMSKVGSHFRQRNMKVSDKEYPALSVSKMGVTPQLDNVALSNAEGNSRKFVKVGDYAVNSRSDRKGSCGVSQYEGSVSLITIVLEPFDIDRGYVHYLFRSNPWIEEFYRNGRGIVADLWTTNYQMMKGMYLPVPPLSEQRAIVSYITERTSKIDTLIEKLTKEIECVKEYKQRLISDVVTGQVKVC